MGQNLVLEPARLGRLQRPLMTARGICVLCLAADRVMLGDDLSGVAHMALFKRAPEAVGDHRIQQLAVAHPKALAHARQEVWTVAHRFHPAGDGNIDVSGRDPLNAEHHRPETRSAHHVDGERRDTVGKAAAERRLPRGILANSRGHDVAHDAFVDDRRIDAGAAHRLRDDQRAELGRGEPFSAPRNFPVGVRTALAMTDSRTPDLDPRHGVVAEQHLQACQDHSRRAGDLARPWDGGGIHQEECPLEADRRGARRRGTDRCVPRESDLAWRKGRAPKQFGKRAGNRMANGQHGKSEI